MMRARRRQAVRHVPELLLRVRLQVRQQPSRSLPLQRLARSSPTAPRAPPDRSGAAAGISALSTGASSSTTCAFVPLIPNELTPAIRGLPLRGHATASAATFTGSSSHAMCGFGALEVQVLRNPTVLERQHRLDDSRHARRRLRVPEVGLHRPDHHRLLRRRALRRAPRPAPAPQSDRRATCPSRGTRRSPPPPALTRLAPAPDGSPPLATARSARSARCSARPG